MIGNSGVIGRRGFLSAAASIGSVAVLTQLFVPESAVAATALETEAAVVAPRSLTTPYGTSIPLRVLPKGSGILKTYADAFTSNKVSFASYYMGSDGKLKIVVTLIGLENQYQVIDVATGVNETSMTPFTSSPAGLTGMEASPAGGAVYSVGDDRLFKYVHGAPTLIDLGQPTPATKTIYGPAFDSKGRVWTGTYPDASVACYDPATGKTTAYQINDPDSKYVRSLAVVNDVVYVGTGSVNPKVISFPVSTPTVRKTLPALPNAATSGSFIYNLDSHYGKLMAHYEDVSLSSKTAIYDPATNAWTPFSYNPSMRMTISAKGSALVYFVSTVDSVSSVLRWNVKDNSIITVGAAPAIPKGMYLSGSTLHIFGEDASGENYVLTAINLTTGAKTMEVAAEINKAPYKVQDFIPSQDGKIYVGGYKGDGLASIDMVTDERWKTPANGPISQIEGMIEYDINRIYVGSYGSADLIHFTKTPMTSTRFARLRKPYWQSRPYAWALAGGYVVAGTVPEYGERGGALAIIDPSNNSLVKVIRKVTETGAPFLPEQSIVSLTGKGDIVYGTTSVMGGYGADNDTKPAEVFAFNVKTRSFVWENKDLTNETEIQSPVIVRGRLFVAVANGIIELDINTGKAISSYVLTDSSLPEGKNIAGYRNIRMGYVEESDSLIHSNSKVVTAVRLRDNTRTLLYEKTDPNETGGPIKVSADGRVFSVTNNTRDISELSIGFSPSITSRADLISISPGGGINVRRSDRNGGYATGVGVGASGYGDAHSVHAADWNDNGIYDVVSNHKDGSLRIRYGLAQGGFEEFKIVAASGWGDKRITVGKWDAASPYPSVLSIDPLGNLDHWKVLPTGGVALVKRLGTGWASRDIAILDFRYDGNPGIVAREGAKMVWYPKAADGTVPLNTTAKVEIASGGWSNCKEFTSTEGHRKSWNGIVWKDEAGGLRHTFNATSTILSGAIPYGQVIATYRLGGASELIS